MACMNRIGMDAPEAALGARRRPLGAAKAGVVPRGPFLATLVAAFTLLPDVVVAGSTDTTPHGAAAIVSGKAGESVDRSWRRPASRRTNLPRTLVTNLVSTSPCSEGPARGCPAGADAFRR